jgi:D-3-phosphoglycerate dehydrogenase / 2-oxoglutarate reductase
MEKRPIVLKAGTENPHPVTGIEYPIPECLNSLRKVADVMVVNDENETTILNAIKGVSVLMITYGQVTRKVIEAGLPTLKAVIKLGTGIDSIDIDAAKENGVRVINCPDYAQNAVAEGAFLLLMNCMKKFGPIHRFVNEQGWMGPSERNKGRNLEKKRIGFVGLGHINSRFACMCQGFDMELQAFDPYVNQTTMETKNITKVEHLDDLMTSSDVVAVCLPLNNETDGLISEKRLRLMKSSAFLINVSRGAIVDEQALLKVLKERLIAGCGLDVFSGEPLQKKGHPLSEFLSMDQVVITPHLAAWTHETWEQLQQEVYRNVMDVLEGRDSVIISSDPRLRNQSGCVYPNQY